MGRQLPAPAALVALGNHAVRLPRDRFRKCARGAVKEAEKGRGASWKDGRQEKTAGVGVRGGAGAALPAGRLGGAAAARLAAAAGLAR